MSRLCQHDVGHEGVITGRDDFSLRSSIAMRKRSVNVATASKRPYQQTYNCVTVISLFCSIKVSSHSLH
ncbi:hypothetical protein [Lysinibacillus sp. NPDC059133]|uniref:hypothetical protein n=1 Tax=Lysinibacillus sp. NPDC059133 TaxID=3346737 RepID=UPI00368CF4AC